MQAWAFAGIHVLSPRIFQSMSIGRLLGAGVSTRGGGKNATGAVTDAVTQTTVAGQPQQAFSIIPEYLRLAGGGENIRGFRADGYYWRDMGTLTSLQQAIEDMERNLIEF
jgi:NDP-sugar pyrophosphorylase family protein